MLPWSLGLSPYTESLANAKIITNYRPTGHAPQCPLPAPQQSPDKGPECCRHVSLTHTHLKPPVCQMLPYQPPATLSVTTFTPPNSSLLTQHMHTQSPQPNPHRPWPLRRPQGLAEKSQRSSDVNQRFSYINMYKSYANHIGIYMQHC